MTKKSKPMTAAELQSLGGKARAAKLTKSERIAIAKQGAQARAAKFAARRAQPKKGGKK
jgi:hypothetical protein